MNNSSLRPFLEYASNQIEKTLTTYRAPGTVTGGSVGPRLIRFDVLPAPGTRVAQIQNLVTEIAIALTVDSVTVRVVSGRVAVEIENPKQTPVNLLHLLPMARKIQSTERVLVVLGVVDVDTPLMLNMASPDCPHAIIAGTTGSGKTMLIKTMLASIMALNSADDVRVAIIDPKGRSFSAFSGSTHLLSPIVSSAEKATALLLSLVATMERRDAAHQQRPAIVLVVEELADLLSNVETADQIRRLLIRLLQRGREAGIHVIAATQRPSAAVVGGLMRANFPLRLVGRVVSSAEANIATGRRQSLAENLRGRGDFLAVMGDTTTRFQAATILDDDAVALVGAPDDARRAEADCLVENDGGDVFAPVAPTEPPDRVAEAVARLRPHWEKLGPALRASVRGTKNAAVRIAFPSCQVPGGRFVEWTNKAIEILNAENRFATATATVTIDV